MVKKAANKPTLVVVEKDVMELSAYAGNAKLHPDKQIKQIVASIKEFGFNDPIAIDENGMIIEGHGRLMAAKRMGMVHVPCIVLDGLSEAKKKAYILAHNKLTMNSGFDEELLAEEILALKQMDEVELSLTGFDETDISELLAIAEEAPENLDDMMEDGGDVLVGAYQLSERLVLYSEDYVEPYGIPKLRKDMLADVPEDLLVWLGNHRTSPEWQEEDKHLFYLFGSDSTVSMPVDRTTIGFYVDDVRFERVWNNLPKFTSKFLIAGVHSLVMPNYSIMAGTPKAVKIYQAYRSRYVARYWQEAGILVIPDLEFGDMSDLEFTMAGIPENAPVIATQIQAYNGKDEEREDEIRQGYGLALEELKPLHLLVYGGEPGLRLGKEICERHGVKFIGVLNRAARMRERVAQLDQKKPF